ncbi:MAG TPA: OFA family MFS transporter [Anaeromyxobacteraceae bacterium]|nr:OFA family MFS transporter [Anaeromyxobacteraceae bacterium]
MASTSSKKGWIVTLAGVGLNLALGILYAWSVFAKQLTEPLDKGGFGWSRTDATLPYTIAIACFALMMVPAGRLQDKLGPRLIATAGSILTGIGIVIASFATPEHSWPAIVGFGLLAGTGFGLGYAAATPAAVKWFPPQKKGLITGLVVGGFGVAPVYIAPLSKWLLGAYGVAFSFRVLGIAFLVSTFLLSQLIVNPEKPLNVAAAGAAAKSGAGADVTWRDMIRTADFWLLWFQYALGATAGLMIIGHLAKIVAVQSGNAIKAGFVFVALLAVFNASGRIVAGIVSDRIGRTVTLVSVFLLQAMNMVFFVRFTSFTGFLTGSAVAGFSYGALLSLFPATAADRWGTKNLGLNYGILFTAWGVGGVFGPILAGKIADATGSYELAYQISAGLLLFAALLAMFSYVNVSVNLPEKEITISVGKKKPGATQPQPS